MEIVYVVIVIALIGGSGYAGFRYAMYRAHKAAVQGKVS